MTDEQKKAQHGEDVETDKAENLAEDVKDKRKDVRSASDEDSKDEGEKACNETSTDEGEKSDAEDEALQNKYLRLMADFQNFKRRIEKEKRDIYAYANEKLAVDLLSVLDNFERALDVETTDEAYKSGMELIFKQLFTALEKVGLEEIEALGVEFDPQVHNAIMMEDKEGFDSGHITEVLQKGYRLNGKVIRPSMVKVQN